MNARFKFGITISINKSKSLDDAVEFIYKSLDTFKNDDFKIVNIKRHPFKREFSYLLLSEHILPEDKKRTMKVYHLILNLFDVTRAKIAKESRRRKKQSI